jgi:hypothetical protein
MCRTPLLSAEHEAGMVTPRGPEVPSNTGGQILELLQRSGSDAATTP